MENQKLELIGLEKPINGMGLTMYFSNGDVKECWNDCYGFKINNELENIQVTIFEYKDKTEWNGKEHKIVGKNESEIAKCIIEGNRMNIDDYMYKIGIFSNTVDVNTNRIDSMLQSNLESTMSSLSSSISFLEHTISEMNNKE